MKRIPYFLCVWLILAACGDNTSTESNKRTSPRIKKYAKIESPRQNEAFVRGEEIRTTVAIEDPLSVDSVVVTVDQETTSYTHSEFQITIPHQRVGSCRLLFKVYFGEHTETLYRTIKIRSEKAPQELISQVVSTYPHDPDDYTQGLLIKDGFLYESTGRKGNSSLKKKELTTGKTLQSVHLSNQLFGEGLTAYNDQFYQLTWTAGKGFVYNSRMEEVNTFNYTLEGWGLATYQDHLIMSDGSEKLYFMEPGSFTVQKTLEVYDHQGKVEHLNELEVIDDLLYANIYQEDLIMVIDPDTGEVLRRIDCSNLLDKTERAEADVLNGIAHDPDTEKIYLTGKWWPKLFEVTFEPKNL